MIRNGVFAAVGNGAAPPPGTRVVDLGGRTVVPGLVEPHVHIVSLANRPGYHTILENTTSIREVQEALAARRRATCPMANGSPRWAVGIRTNGPSIATPLAPSSTRPCPIGPFFSTSASRAHVP